MNLQKKNLWLVFSACLATLLILPIFFPYLRLQYFVPFLIILIYQKSLIRSLWGSLGCGLFLDLLSVQGHLGLHALTFTACTAILYRQRRHFFADSPSTLPLMTFFYATLATVIELLLLSIFEQPPHLSKLGVVTDLIVMPIGDALFGFVLFILPFYLFGSPIRRGKDYFMEKR